MSTFNPNDWYNDNKGKIDSLARMGKRLPFVNALMLENRYDPHPTEPTIFTFDEMGVSSNWASWLVHMYRYGETGVGERKEVDPVTLPSDLQQVIKGVHLMLSLMVKNKTFGELSKEPPSIFTTDGLYLSQKWVIDTAIRDNMPPHEAVVLGRALAK